MIIDAADLDPAHAYKLLIGSIIPRAIAWVSTLSVDGIANLAPVSFFTGAGRSPPMVVLGFQTRSDGVTLKDTFVNIRDTGEFVSNFVTLSQAHEMHRTAFEFPPEIDEFEAVGLQKAPSVAVRPPRVAGAPISMECRVERIIPVGTIQEHVVLGEVLRFHIRDDLYLPRGRVDTGALPAVGRLAAEYTLVTSIFTTPLDDETLDQHNGQRMARLDGHPDGWSPIDSNQWSPSGSTMSDPAMPDPAKRNW
jgi:flavin reductase (DIM6/NTAB) family NADH-FMN oxidoreductase RutF